MDLSEPRDAVCPLCRGLPGCDDHRVEIQENKAGSPYFHCERHKVPVNMNGGEASEQALVDSIETLAEAEEQIDDQPTDDGPSLGDLLGNND